jgi:hypothetical protein
MVEMMILSDAYVTWILNSAGNLRWAVVDKACLRKRGASSPITHVYCIGRSCCDLYVKIIGLNNFANPTMLGPMPFAIMDTGGLRPDRNRVNSHPRSTQPSGAPPEPANVSPVTRTAVSLEYASLRHSQHCPLGMYVVPSPENLLMWDAIFFVHQGESNLV